MIKIQCEFTYLKLTFTIRFNCNLIPMRSTDGNNTELDPISFLTDNVIPIYLIHL